MGDDRVYFSGTMCASGLNCLALRLALFRFCLQGA